MEEQMSFTRLFYRLIVLAIEGLAIVIWIVFLGPSQCANTFYHSISSISCCGSNIISIWSGVMSFSAIIATLFIAFQENGSNKSYGIRLSLIIDDLFICSHIKILLEVFFAIVVAFSVFFVSTNNLKLVFVSSSSILLICIGFLVAFVFANTRSGVEAYFYRSITMDIKAAIETKYGVRSVDKGLHIESPAISLFDEIISNDEISVYEMYRLIEITLKCIVEYDDVEDRNITAIQIFLVEACIIKLLLKSNQPRIKDAATINTYDYQIMIDDIMSCDEEYIKIGLIMAMLLSQDKVAFEWLKSRSGSDQIIPCIIYYVVQYFNKYSRMAIVKTFQNTERPENVNLTISQEDIDTVLGYIVEEYELKQYEYIKHFGA